MAITLDDFLEGSNLLGNLGVLHAGGSGLGHLQLALVEGFALHLPLCLESSHNVLVLPANLMSEPAKGAEPPSVLQPQNLQSGWDDHELLFVIGRGNSLEGLQPLKGILSALSLVGGHATDSAPEDLALVEGFALHLPLCLESSHNVLVLPANLMSEPAKGAE